MGAVSEETKKKKEKKDKEKKEKKEKKPEQAQEGGEEQEEFDDEGSIHHVIGTGAHLLEWDWWILAEESGCEDEVNRCKKGPRSKEKGKRKLAFSVAARKYRHIRRSDMTEDETNDYWYSSKDRKKMNTSKDKYVRRMEKGKPAKGNITYRGLECWTDKGARQLESRIEAVLNAVLDEQDRQWEENDDDESIDPELIREASRKASKKGRERARKLGLEDEEEVVRIWEDDEDGDSDCNSVMSNRKVVSVTKSKKEPRRKKRRPIKGEKGEKEEKKKSHKSSSSVSSKSKSKKSDDESVSKHKSSKDKDKKKSSKSSSSVSSKTSKSHSGKPPKPSKKSSKTSSESSVHTLPTIDSSEDCPSSKDGSSSNKQKRNKVVVIDDMENIVDLSPLSSVSENEYEAGNDSMAIGNDGDSIADYGYGDAAPDNKNMGENVVRFIPTMMRRGSVF